MDVTDFHVKNDYIVSVTRGAGNSVLANFPKVTIFGNKVKEKTYSYLIDNNKVLKTEGEDSVEFEAPPYSLRSFVYLDIVILCNKRGISYDLIVCKNFDGSKHLGSPHQLLDPPKEEGEKKREIEFRKILAQMIVGNVDTKEAQNLGFEDGYKKVVELLTKKGI